ncbi:aldo/keto reductase, partial [bacterium]|nr:aldo/keto reductase [bacterium]
RARDEGMIRHICCSFHDTPEALVKLAETGAIESITLQYNLLDRTLDEALHRLKELNVGVVVMGPIGGGRLGVDSERLRALTGHRVQSVPEAALRFVLAHPAVNVALSGMTTVEMLRENGATVAEKQPFTAAEIAELDAEVQRVRERRGVTCTACGYCLPCASGVDIPANFGIYNNYTIYGLKESAQKAYKHLTGPAIRCIECGACLPKCPQKIDIPHVLRKVVTELDTGFDGWGVLFAVTGFKQDSIRGRVTVRNLTDRPVPAAVTVELADGARCEPSTIEFTNLVAGTTQSKPVQIDAPDGVGIIEGQVRALAGDELRASALRVPILVIPRDQLRWHTAKLAPKDFRGGQELLATHGYRIGLRHDDDRVFVELAVRSQLHGLARPGESSGARMEMYVDMRPADQGFGRQPYADGVDQLFLSLATPAGAWGSQSNKQYALNQQNERTEEGVRISLELPFKEFLKPGWPVPNRIGLDFMFVVCDAERREIGYPTYGGQGGLYGNPAGFTAAVLV